MQNYINKPSLSEVNASVDTSNKTGFWKKLFAFMGPAYLISVGYMDPGNWATDIAAGSQFGYTLLWVLLMSNLMALLLQSLSARLGIVSGRDLAQASRENYPKAINYFLYALAEIAIAACDLAEVIGMAIGLQLLFDIPLLVGVTISVLDTFILLFLLRFGIRKMEAFILTLVAIIGVSFLVEMIFAKPAVDELVKGFVPSIPNDIALYIAIGIIGATVMPHNLYLHSSLVQTRRIERDFKSLKSAIKFNIIDSAIALNLAFFVNAAILILAASAFFRSGMFQVSEIQDAHKFLQPMLGTQWAPVLFAIALIAAGQSSTVTGTLAGQIIMEGYLNLRIQPWIRRLLTRILAIVPAYLAIYYLGEAATGELLILSQVILSLQLGFAVIPLIHFVSNKNKMGEFAIGLKIKVLAWLSALIIVSLNIKLVYEELNSWLNNPQTNPLFIWILVIPILAAALLLLLYITFGPLFKKTSYIAYLPHNEFKPLEELYELKYKKIAVAVDFSSMDNKAINQAISQGGKKAEFLLIHVVETPGALIMGDETKDMETLTDKENLNNYREKLINQGYDVIIKLGYGNPKKAISDIVNQEKVDLVVMAAHGHRGFKDIIFGTTVDAVRHRINVPLFIVN